MWNASYLKYWDLNCLCLIFFFFLQFWGSRRFHFLFKTLVFTKTKTEDCSTFAVFCFILFCFQIFIVSNSASEL